MPRHVEVPMSYGELIDRITILEIKAERMTDKDQLENINRELSLLRRILCSLSDVDATLVSWTAYDLRRVNEQIWDDEDRLRLSDDHREIADIAVRVFQNNDRRHAIKRKFDEATRSDIVEEKSY